MAYSDYEDIEMHETEPTDTIENLARELAAWREHIDRRQLSERKRFVEWLSETMTRQQLALAIDGEIDRSSLWNSFLYERFGC